MAHLLFVFREQLDWGRLLRRFGTHWRVLLAHLLLFGYVYPRHAGSIPRSLLKQLTERLERESPPPTRKNNPCRGPMLSRTQYAIDVSQWGLTPIR